MRIKTSKAISRFGICLIVFALIGCGGGSMGDGQTPGPISGTPNETGIPAALAVCSASNPCTKPAAELGVSQVSYSSYKPECKTSENARLSGRPVFDDGEPLLRVDAQGVNRYACLYAPPGASATATYPLLVFLHGGGAGAASNVYDYTSLRSKAVNFDLSGDPAKPGFFLLSIQGRSLHYPTFNSRDGHHHDFYFRDLSSPSTNPDIANLDTLIDDLVATGHIDTKRIYLMGWSNGGFFSQLYGIARYDTATPNGNKVAAVVPYTAADPFNNTSRDQIPSYQLDPYPTAELPIFLVSRSCDIVACDQAQADWFERGFGAVIEPGHVVKTWVDQDLLNKVNNSNVDWLLVDYSGTAVSVCASNLACTFSLGVLNHLRWPDGVADGSGIDHEPAMLGFLRDHARAD